MRIHQHANIQAIRPMRSGENTPKSQIWRVSASQSSAKMRKSNNAIISVGVTEKN